jgi:predicted CoA-binding protein
MPLVTTDEGLRNILMTYRRIVVVGISANPDRPSQRVARFLQQHGYQLSLVNPLLAGKTVLGLQVYPTLADLPEPPEMVDVFRRSEYVAEVAEAAIAVGANVLWTQLGVRDDVAAQRASDAGLLVVQDRCPAIEYPRLGIGQR